MESITNRALAGELDSGETAGTLIRLMNYSYVNSEDAAPTKGASKNRYKVNHLTDQDASIDEINAFCQFCKFYKFKKNLREADENGGVNQVGETDVPDHLISLHS